MAGPWPLISVIVAVRNGATTLQRTLDSVFEQTYPHVELVVIDGASTDGTADILNRNADRLSYWESEPDRGVYQAWNKALEHVTGDWISFLGADDRFSSPTVLERMAAVIARAAGTRRVVYGTVRVIGSDGSVRATLGTSWETARERFVSGDMVPHPATFHHRSVFTLRGRFDESFRIAGDYELLLREVLENPPLFAGGEPIVDMAAGGLSARPSSTYRVLYEIHRARYLHGVERAAPWRSGRLARSLIGLWITRTFGAHAAASVGAMCRLAIPRRKRKPRSSD